MVLNSEFYAGEYSNGKKNGKGRYTWPNGNYYDGWWQNDKINGYGAFYVLEKDKSCFYMPREIRYEGHWLNGKRHGKGKSYFDDGSIYEREYVLGKRIS